MRKSLLRFSVALFAFAAALTTAPKRAAAAATAFNCPSTTLYEEMNVWDECIDGFGAECSTCSYYCPAFDGDLNGGHETINMCAS